MARLRPSGEFYCYRTPDLILASYPSVYGFVAMLQCGGREADQVDSSAGHGGGRDADVLKDASFFEDLYGSVRGSE